MGPRRTTSSMVPDPIKRQFSEELQRQGLSLGLVWEEWDRLPNWSGGSTFGDFVLEVCRYGSTDELFFGLRMQGDCWMGWFAPTPERAYQSFSTDGEHLVELIGDWARCVKRESQRQLEWPPESEPMRARPILLQSRMNFIADALAEKLIALKRLRWAADGTEAAKLTWVRPQKSHCLTLQSKLPGNWDVSCQPGRISASNVPWNRVEPIIMDWTEIVAKELQTESTYLQNITISNLRCLSQAEVEFQYPGRVIPGTLNPAAQVGMENLNLIVGDNGSGKSTVLKAIALVLLGGILPHQGFPPPYHLVREGQAEALIAAKFVTAGGIAEFGVKLVHRGRDQILDGWSYRLPGAQADQAIPGEIWFQDGPDFFLCGYGVTARRAESADVFDPSQRERSRRRRYQQVASLFEEAFALRPISRLFAELKDGNGQKSRHFEEAGEILDRVLDGTGTTWSRDFVDGVMQFRQADGLNVPVDALSDGFCGFLSWIGDLLWSLVDVAPGRLGEVAGTVLVDEIDQHLHPRWQRTVLPTLARTFPKLQFILTSHSPILVGCLPPENIYVSERDSEGAMRLRPAQENYRGETIDQILLSPYFQLTTTLDPEMEQKRQTEVRLRSQLGQNYLKERTPEAAEAYLAALEPLE